jgi:hypothetical protein
LAKNDAFARTDLENADIVINITGAIVVRSWIVRLIPAELGVDEAAIPRRIRTGPA